MSLGFRRDKNCRGRLFSEGVQTLGVDADVRIKRGQQS